MNLLPSISRTAVPVIVGYLLSMPLVVRLEDAAGVAQGDRNAWLSRGVTAGITVVYYVAARFIEQRYPKLGSLLVGLGAAKAPVYPVAPVGAHAAPAAVAQTNPDVIERI